MSTDQRLRHRQATQTLLRELGYDPADVADRGDSRLTVHGTEVVFDVLERGDDGQPLVTEDGFATTEHRVHLLPAWLAWYTGRTS